MAVRQLIPEFNPAGFLGMSELKVLRKMREPALTEFRAGANIQAVVKEVLASSLAKLEAAAAGGKSTLVPAAMARETGGLVVHLCPNKYLADDLCKYVSRNSARDLKTVHMDKPTDSWPESGVVFISSACLVAKWLESGEVIMPECVVFHDESHESDGFNYLAKVLLPQLTTVKTYVSATATSAPAGFRSFESKGALTKKEFDDDGQAWDVFDSGKPWYSDGDGDNCLIFEDRKDRANALKAGFVDAGWEAYRFHARMPLSEFQRVMARMRLPNTPCIAIIADSTFRSGFTMPVTRIVDSGYVAMVVAVEGEPRRVLRPATMLERYQAAARGARMQGQRTTYWSPSFDAPAVIHDLEASEMDLAVLCLRLLGYEVPRVFQGTVGATMGVPRELSAALRGDMPLAVLREEQLVSFSEFASPAGRQSPYLADDVELEDKPYDFHPAVSADTAGKWGLQGARKRVDSGAGGAVQVMAPKPLRPRQMPVAPEVPEDGDISHDDALRDIYAGEVSETVLESTKAYVAVGIGHGEVQSSAFPRGADSVMAQLATDLSGSLHLGYDSYTRGAAVNLLLDRHNESACKVMACQTAIVQARNGCSGKDAAALREWAATVVESMARSIHEGRVVDGVLHRLMQGFCGIAEISYSQQIRTAAEGLLGVAQQLPSDKRFVEAVGRGVASMADSQVRREHVALPTVNMPTVGRGMRAVARPRAVAEWMAGPRYYTGAKYIQN